VPNVKSFFLRIFCNHKFLETDRLPYAMGLDKKEKSFASRIAATPFAGAGLE
jgi:hypothetical protein